MKGLNFLKLAFGAVALAVGLNVNAVEYKEVQVFVTPDPIPANCNEIRITFQVDGEQVYYKDQGGGEYYQGTPLTVEDNVGLKYTDMYIWNQMDWTTFETYGLCVFDKALEQGVYEIVFPLGAFEKRDEEGELIWQSVPFGYTLTIGDPSPEPPGLTGFVPTQTYPAAGTDIDNSYTDWMIVVYFDEEPVMNDEIKPYLLLGDEMIEADNALCLPNYKQINYDFYGMSQRPNGTYTFVLPAGAVSYNDGQTNQTWTCKFGWKGGTNGNIGDVGEAKILSATIGDVNIMEEGIVVPNIPAENCFMKIAVEPDEVIGIIVSIVDVTGLTPDKFGDLTNEAVWVNTMEDKVGNTFSKQIYSIDGIKLYNDKTYVVKAELCNVLYPIQSKIATLYSATFTGETDAFVYSPVDLVSIEPAPGSEFTSKDALVLTYSAPVTLEGGEGKSGFANGNAGYSPFSSITSNSDKTVWTIKFTASGAGQNTIMPHIWGYDENGLILRPSKYNVDMIDDETLVFNDGFERTSYTEIRYSNYSACAKVVVSPLETEELTAIDFSIEGDKEMQPSYMAPFPKIKNEAGEVVAVVFVDMYEEDGGHIVVLETSGSGSTAKNIKLQAPLDNAIKTPGTYTLELPWNLFGVGSEFNSSTSAPGIYTIIVSKKTAVEEIDENLEAPVYFTIDGVRVENPTKGLYIKVQGSKAAKVVL